MIARISAMTVSTSHAKVVPLAKPKTKKLTTVAPLHRIPNEANITRHIARPAKSDRGAVVTLAELAATNATYHMDWHCHSKKSVALVGRKPQTLQKRQFQ